ncbi:hypothetical protein BJX99DRAFT_261331 [Aspergillus californicus]
MSGIEFTGIVLAFLPLMVNQLDNYARGIETIKGLRRYRWQLEGYSSNLSAQYAIFLNTLEIVLQDVVDDQERCELLSNPDGRGWKDGQFQTAFKQKLGRNYHAFTGTVSGLCGLLEEVSGKLGRHDPDYSKAATVISLGTIKFRKILSKAVYEDMIDRIDKANQILKTLSEQSQQLDQARARPRWRKGLKRHRDGRRHARALYDILVQGQGWKCMCRDNHTVYFRLDASTIRDPRDTKQGCQPRFLMMLSARNESQTNCNRKWHEIELQPEFSDDTVSVHLEETSLSVSEGKRKVQFASGSTTTLCVEAMRSTSKASVLIGDLCSTFGSFHGVSPMQNDAVGYIRNQTSDTRYTMRLIRRIEQDLSLRSLQDIFAGSTSSAAPAQHPDVLSRRDRLYLAAVLACGVLQLHGSWLKQQWGTRDVLFARDAPHSPLIFEHPYLVWQVMGQRACDHAAPLPSNKLQNEVLLPLAVALIELSLGKTISAMYREDDQHPSEAQVRFNTATRVLMDVYYESGSNYGDVVKECLYWSRGRGEQFGDPLFDESVFDTVVSPLLKDFDYFEGVAQPP